MYSSLFNIEMMVAKKTVNNLCSREMSSKLIFDMEQIQLNKQLILDFYGRIIAQRDIAHAHKIIAENYIQHNPLVKSGRAGLVEVLEQLKQMPQDPAAASNNTLWLLEEGNLVGTYLKVDFLGQKQIVMDLFRVEAGKIVEHWDAIQSLDDQTFSDIPAIPAVTNDLPTGDTTLNKERVQTYLQEVWQKQQHHLLGDFVNSNITFYHPEFGQGYAQLQEYQQQISLQKVHRLIAEGDFVMAQCSVIIQEEAQVLYTTYRLEQGKIVETWSVSQAIPTQMAHTNGMI